MRQDPDRLKISEGGMLSVRGADEALRHPLYRMGGDEPGGTGADHRAVQESGFIIEKTL